MFGSWLTPWVATNRMLYEVPRDTDSQGCGSLNCVFEHQAEKHEPEK